MAVLSNGIWTNVVLSVVDSVERWTILISTSNLPGVPHLWRRHGSQVVTAGVSHRAETAADVIHVIHVIRHAPPPCCTWISWILKSLDQKFPKPKENEWCWDQKLPTSWMVWHSKTHHLIVIQVLQHRQTLGSAHLVEVLKGKNTQCPDHGIILRSLVVLVSLTMKSFGLCPGSDPCFLREIDLGVHACVGDCASVCSLPSASTARVLEGIAPHRSTHRCFYM